MAFRQYDLASPDAKTSDVVESTGSSITGAVRVTIDNTKIRNKQQLSEVMQLIKQYVETYPFPNQ